MCGERGPERPRLCSSLQVDSFAEKLDLTLVVEARAAPAGAAGFRVALVMAPVRLASALQI